MFRIFKAGRDVDDYIKDMAVSDTYEEFSYHEKIKMGWCPECNTKGRIVVVPTYEWVKRDGKEVKEWSKGIRCQICGQFWLLQVLEK